MKINSDYNKVDLLLINNNLGADKQQQSSKYISEVILVNL